MVLGKRGMLSFGLIIPEGGRVALWCGKIWLQRARRANASHENYRWRYSTSSQWKGCFLPTSIPLQRIDSTYPIIWAGLSVCWVSSASGAFSFGTESNLSVVLFTRWLIQFRPLFGQARCMLISKGHIIQCNSTLGNGMAALHSRVCRSARNNGTRLCQSNSICDALRGRHGNPLSTTKSFWNASL